MTQEEIALGIVAFSIFLWGIQLFRKKGASSLSHFYLEQGKIKKAFFFRRFAGRYWKFKS